MAENLAVFSQRFAAKRLRGVIDNDMTDAKREIISRSAFKELLNISPFAAPMELIEFVVIHTNSKLREFRYRGKAIVFTRGMVKKGLGVPSGNRPLDMLKRGQNAEMRNMYRNEKGRPTIAKAVQILKKCKDDDEAGVVMNFGLVAFATVLCPGTGNMTNLDYLGSLMDKDKIEEYAIDEHILSEIMKEVEVFQQKIERRRSLDAGKIWWIGQCLPLLATVYMDFLSFPPLSPNLHTIQYHTPRFCFVCDADFELVVEIDKNRLSLSPTAFGKRPLLPLSSTIYADCALPAPPNGNDEKGSQDTEVNASASLNEWIEKGFPTSQDIEVPEHLVPIYSKHKELYSAEADVALNNFGVVMKAINVKRMAALLVDVDAANREAASFTIPCPLSFAGHSSANASEGRQEKEATARPPATSNNVDDQEKEVAASVIPEKQQPEQDTASILPEDLGLSKGLDDVAKGQVVAELESLDSPARQQQTEVVEISPRRRNVPAGYWDEPAPSFELFPAGSEEAILFVSVPDSPTKLASALQSPATATSGDSSGYATPVNTDEDAQATRHIVTVQDISSGPATHDKKNRHKRAAKDANSPPIMKKPKAGVDVEKIYQKFIMHSRKFRPRKKDNPSKPFVQIDGFYVTYKPFQASLKPRAWLDNQVMSLFVEQFNIENDMKAKANRRLKRKFAFSTHMAIELVKDPAKFVTNNCMAEFKNACVKYNLVKMDLVHFPILHDKHWVSCCLNMLHKEWNLLDSMKSSKNYTSIAKAVQNLIVNMGTLTKECEEFTVDITNFKLGGPSDYPQQRTLYDCGFFVMLYMHHFDGRAMAIFDKDSIPAYRKIVAADFINHTLNTEDSAAVLEDELE